MKLRRDSVHWRSFFMKAAICVGALAATNCSDHQHLDDLASDDCREHPENCDGGVGTLCIDDHDCIDPLFCCDDNNNCGDGMCTADCQDDHDCPSGMLCQHDMCFYTCESDADCAETMSCEHGETVCEYN